MPSATSRRWPGVVSPFQQILQNHIVQHAVDQKAASAAVLTVFDARPLRRGGPKLEGGNARRAGQQA